MGLPNFSVRRPVTTVMIFLGVLLLGAISWTRLPQELYPPITYPQLSVVTLYKDAAPEEMEVLITKLVEEAIGTVSGVRRISSTSKEETSLVVAEFNWGTNMDFAALGVREKIDLIKEALPRGCEDPIVMKFNPFELPVAVLNVTAEELSPGELRETTRKVIKNELEKAYGVASCNISGGDIREILIEVDLDKMMAKNIAITDIVDAVNKANLNYPAGTIEEQFYEYLIRTIGEFKMVSEIEDVVVGVDDRTKKSRFEEFGLESLQEKQERAPQNKRLMLLKEIATIKDTFKEKSSISRFNQKDNVSVSMQKQAGANTVKVADSIKQALRQLKKQLPPYVKMSLVYDQSYFIKKSLTGVRDAALLGGVLAFLVLYFFLRSVKSAIFVAFNIPLSIMAVFTLMYFSGVTINMISLGGLALGVGMLVDNGIVVIENIYRHRQKDKKPKEASVYGANEVGGAITGSTLTTIAVFLPMIFVIGIAGQLFKELAFTVTFSLVASLAVAMAIIPLLTARFGGTSSPSKEGYKQGIVGSFLSFIQNIHSSILHFFLNRKAACLGCVFLVFVGSLLLFPVIDREFLPRVDQGQFLIKVNLPPGTKLDIADSVVKKIEDRLFDFSEVKNITVNIGSSKEEKAGQLLETMGSHQAQMIVNLKPMARFGKTGPGYRMVSTQDILARLKDSLEGEDLESADVNYILQESVFKGAFQAGSPVIIEVKGQALKTLRKTTENVMDGLKRISGIYGVKSSLIKPSPEVKVNVLKKKASNYNLSVSDIAITAQTAIKGYIATKFKQEGEEIDVAVKLTKKDRDQLSKIRMVPLHSPLGMDVPLAEVAYLVKGVGPSEIKRQDQERIVVITANIFKKGFSEIQKAIDAMLDRLKVPAGYSAELTGEKEQIRESFTSLLFALGLSVLLVYMIMASQFESLWQPFIIMFTIPLSLIGVVLILIATKTPLSVMVFLGLIVLGGIVVNNGIVLIDYVNVLRRQGLSVFDAVVESSQTRLRPILMTALTTILGLMPLALGLMEGAKLQRPMAITIIGGLTISSFLSLVVIPTLYVCLAQFLGKEKIIVAEEKGKLPTPPPAIPEIKEKEPTIILLETVKGIKIEYEEDIKIPPKPPKPEEKAPAPPPEPEKPILLPGPEEPALPPEPEKPAPEPEEPKPPPPPPEKPEKPTPPPEPEKPKRPAPSLRLRLPKDVGRISPDVWDSLHPRLQEVISYLRRERKITRKEYVEIFNVSVPTAARDLKILSKKRIIKAKGPAGPGRYYALCEGT